MQSLESLILFDALAAFGSTLEAALEARHRSNVEATVVAHHAYLVCHRDLTKFLHEFTPNARLECGGQLAVEADDEGGVHFRDWTVRPTGRKAVLLCN